MKLSFQLEQAFVDTYRTLDEPFGFNGLGSLTFYRTYSRRKPDGSYESWVDVCQRVINGMYSIQKDHCAEHNRPWDEHKAQESAKEGFDRMFNLKWTPSGRGLWMVGTPFIHERKISEALQNCAFISTQNINEDHGDIFRWFMEMLMLGVGVGADVRGAGKVFVGKPEDFGDIDPYVIKDTRESWAESVATLVDSYLYRDETEYDYAVDKCMTSTTIYFDYSQIRKKGEPIKGFGGTSSGPEPLMKLHDRIREYMDKNAGEYITARTLIDIFNAIGGCVVAGNVRRSAEIMFADFGDEDFANLKNYELNPERAEIAWASNNSFFTPIGSDYSTVVGNISKNGEPGFYWLENAQKYGRMGEEMIDNAIGGNPCFAAGTLVQTRQGHFPIESLIGQVVEIWNGEGWQTVDNFRITATDQEVLRITMQDGSEIRCTPYHTFILENGERITADELVVGDKLKITDAPQTHGNIHANGAYLKGFLIGDGTNKRNSQASLWVYEGKEVCNNRLLSSALEIDPIVNTNAVEEVKFDYKEYGRRKLYNMTGLGCRSHELIAWCTTYKNGLPAEVFEWDLESKSELIAGLFDSDGTAFDTKNGFSYQFTTISKQLALDIQALLKTISVNSKIGTQNKGGGKTDFGDDYGEYKTKESYRITLSQSNSIKLAQLIAFERLVDFSNKSTEYSMKPRFNTIISIENDGVEDEVYCCTVDGNHQFSLTNGYDVGQCLEQPLAHKELCNLVEVYMNRHDDLYDYLRTLKFAYLYGKTMTLTYEWIKDDETREIMQKNRRIGLSNTGIAQFLSENGLATLIKWLDKGYDNVRHYDGRYSMWFDINESIRVTTVKPSGSVSLLAGSTPGIHHPTSEYYIRRIRLQSDSDLVKVLRNAGFYVEEDVYSDNTMCVEFPVHVGKGVKQEQDLTVWEQFALAAVLQKYWSDNAVSITVKFDPNKTSEDELAAVLNYYQYQLKGVSLLPEVEDGAYPQMPYEPITKEKYERMLEKINMEPLNNLARTLDQNDKMYELYCTTDYCSFMPIDNSQSS